MSSIDGIPVNMWNISCFLDVNECETERPCSRGMDCINTAGGFDCKPSKTPKKYDESKICYCLWLFLIMWCVDFRAPLLESNKKITCAAGFKQYFDKCVGKL